MTSSTNAMLVVAAGLWLLGCGGGSDPAPPEGPHAPRIQAFSPSKSTLGAGEAVTFSWQVDGGGDLVLEGPGGLVTPVQGSNQVWIPARSGTYTLRATNSLGSASAGTPITVNAPLPSQALFPFTLPWSDATATVTDLSGLLPKPAGAAGFVRVQDGHLATSTGRIRFWGTNTTFQANFPTHEEAEALASRMAKSGINLVRFHHMDTSATPHGIWTTLSPDRTLDATQLDRLDYFIHRLKEHGIYSDLNLLVGRPLARGSELSADIEQIDSWKARHALGFFDPQILQLQKDFAQALLAHVNPYTGKAYTDEPAVALVEIINEQGMARAFKDGQLDALPPFYAAALKARWNTWLQSRYGTQSALQTAWGATVIDPPGAELLQNPGFASGLSPWNLEQHDTAQATATVVTDEVPAGLTRSVKLQLLAKGTAGWHIQFNQSGLALDAATPYTLSFWAKSDRSQSIDVGAGMAHDPWSGLGFSQALALDTTWRAFTFTFVPSAGEANARLNFSNMGLASGTVWLSGLTLKPGGYLGLMEGEDLATSSVGTFRISGEDPRTLAGWKDWFHFLTDLESAYWTEMRSYLEDTLGVKQPVVGTIVGYATPNSLASFEVQDTHSYWMHPAFPGTAWDSRNWYVSNRPMVNHPGEATLPGLAMQRLVGKPHIVTEYDHPAPNTFQAEGLWTLAAYAGFQDFDAALQFAYSGDRSWTKTTLDSYFDMAHNPVQMASMTAAAAAFLRGDIAPAQQQVVASLSLDQEWSALAARSTWQLPDGRQGGLAPLESLIHGTAIATQGQSVPGSALAPGSTTIGGPVWASDTGELRWDTTDAAKGCLIVDSPRTRMLIGYLGGKSFDFEDLELFAGPSLQQGFGALSFTVLEGSSFAQATRILITALGTQQNPGAAWATYPGTPVAFPPAVDTQVTFLNNQWGQGPTQVEGLITELILPLPPEQVHVYALDPTGVRKGEILKLGDTATHAVLSPIYQTLMYEVQIER